VSASRPASIYSGVVHPHRHAVAAVVSVVSSGCLAQSEGVLGLGPRADDAGVRGVHFVDGAISKGGDDAALPATRPHSVRNVDPSHGPFTGGQHALVRGTGFGADLRVWFGETLVAGEDTVPVDATRAQVSVPAGHAGVVDVTVQNGDDESTRATLHEGYVYDAFYVSPASGPVAGGTVITLHGEGTSWDSSTVVTIDGAPCVIVSVKTPSGAPQQLQCRTPSGTPGSKTVSVATPGGAVDVQDGFVYSDSDNGFRGGLSGAPLERTMRIVVLNAYTAKTIAGAKVVLGSDPKPADVMTADANGVVIVDSPNLAPSQTVTVAKRCFMPTTFVNVSVDTITAYLDPVLSPDCMDNGQITGVGTGGGTTGSQANVRGEIVWPRTGELRKGPWDVPIPKPPDGGALNPRRVAYVLELSSDPARPFRLPPPSEAITPDVDGQLGYSFTKAASVGNVTLYALAGVEDRNQDPPIFTAYTLGLVRGVATKPGSTVSDVYLQMDIPLDHALALDVHGPKPTSRGPDRFDATVAVRIGGLGSVLLPAGSRGALLPATAPVTFVGLPPLIHALKGAEYALSAAASTGLSHSTPKSVLGVFSTAESAGPVTLDGFLEVPALATPGPNGSWNGRDLDVTAAPGGPDEDLTLFEIQSGGGLSTWDVVAPRGVRTIRLPDAGVVPDIGLTRGPVTVTVSRARIDDFEYAALRYTHFTARGWDSYATDVFQAHY
jgi:hypothetical protein